MDRKEIEKEIREYWFKDHIADFQKINDRISILDWNRPDTICYSCRYVFDGSRVYVSGDIGEAVFCLTWKADIHSFNDIHIGYFEEKLSAYSGERRDFDSDKAVRRLREWVKGLKEEGIKYDHDEMKELFERARSCSSSDEWRYAFQEQSDFISDLDQDYWEWMYSIGDEIPRRIYGYLIGLQMASEQLKAESVTS